jgi:hypothetical protein
MFNYFYVWILLFSIATLLLFERAGNPIKLFVRWYKGTLPLPPIQSGSRVSSPTKKDDSVSLGSALGSLLAALSIPALVIFGLSLSSVWQSPWVQMAVPVPLPAILEMVVLAFILVIVAWIDFIPLTAISTFVVAAIFIVGFFPAKASVAHAYIWHEMLGAEKTIPIVSFPIWFIVSLVAFVLLWVGISAKESHKKGSGNGVAFFFTVLVITFLGPPLLVTFLSAVWTAIR